MPTLLDKALKSKNAVLAFSGLVTAAVAWSLWSGDLFPAESDPSGNPETWTREEMRRWLAARNLLPDSHDTEEQLRQRVMANVRR
ncbi:hypothetical protein GGR50DRAFT_637388 [Xylaria sp. CBS 124048]|nr:hypothetical protein GGR50DRAFT_637388 [Xylaria sp. CBS 124048]